MTRRYVVVAAFFGIAACATTGPDSPEPGANARDSVTNSSSAATEEELEVVEVPAVPISANIPARPVVICHREQKIGSRRVKRVCRSQSEIDKKEAAARDALNDLQKAQALRQTRIVY